MAIEIMDMDASEVPEAPSASARAPATASRNAFLRRFEREWRRQEDCIARRSAD